MKRKENESYSDTEDWTGLYGDKGVYRKWLKDGLK